MTASSRTDPLQMVTVKLRTSGLARIDAIADAEELTRTDVVRRLLRDGLAAHDRDRRSRR